MGKVVIKAGINLKGGDLRLDNLDQLPCVIHAGNSILHAHDVGMDFGQRQHRLRRDGIAGVVGKIINVDIAMNLSCQAVIVLQQRLSGHADGVHRLNGKLGHLPALIHWHGKKFAGAALHQNAVNTVFNQIVEQLLLAFKIQAAVFVKERDCRRQICCVHDRTSFLVCRHDSVSWNHIPN